MKVGIFSGSFNPVHIGHLALANYICEFDDLDEVWFVVTPHNPFKDGQELMDDNLRLNMVKHAVEGYPHFRVSDIEFGLPRPSYTINTLDKLNELYPHNEFHLIVGSDNWSCFNSWREARRILATSHILVYPRSGYPVDTASLPPNVRLVNAPIIEISSTFIRQALRTGKDIRYFLPPSVWKEMVLHSRSDS